MITLTKAREPTLRPRNWVGTGRGSAQVAVGQLLSHPQLSAPFVHTCGAVLSPGSRHPSGLLPLSPQPLACGGSEAFIFKKREQHQVNALIITVEFYS